MRRTIVRTVSFAAAFAASLGVLCCPALAGSYVVSACSPSGSPGLWAQTNTFPSVLATGNLCGGPAIGPADGSHQGALFAEDILNSSPTIPDGARAGWTFTAPASATITAISYYRSLHAYNDPNMISGLFMADGTALEQCKIPWPFVAGSSIHCDRVNNQAPVTFTGLNTRALFLGMGCRLVEPESSCGAGGAPLHAASADLYSARVTVSESGAPMLSSVAGGLWGGGVVSGIVPVTFAASDASGIHEQFVRSDTGQTLISSLHPCDFGNTPPCPQQPAGTLNVDTTRVPDGARTFSLVVTDAAGNSQVSTSPTIVVDNDGPPPPPAFSATAKGGESNVVALAWRNPVNAPAPVTAAQVQLCQGACAAPVTVGSSGAGQITAPGLGIYTVRLWLLDSQGRGGPHNAALASVTVPPAPTIGGSSSVRTQVTGTLTGRTLRVVGTVARTGRVLVSWRSKVGSRTRGHGSRLVAVRGHRVAVTFRLSPRARRGTIRVVVRSGTSVIARARVRQR